MNPQRRQALMLARRLICCKAEDFICVALTTVGQDYPELFHETVYLRSYIDKQLGPYYSLNSWQRYQQHLYPTHGRDDRADRCAWIDWMVAE